MTDRDRAIDKLKKLYAHAKSAEKIGSEAEAQAFAAKFQELLSVHKLEMTDIEWEQDQTTNPIIQEIFHFADHGLRHRKRVIPWLRTLASCVAWAHYCQILVINYPTTDFWFVGRKTDIEAAGTMYTYLVNAAERLADKEYVKYFYECKDKGDATRARGFRNSWLEGFAKRMHWRYWEEMERIKNEAAKGMQAIVRLDDVRAQIKKFIEDMFSTRKKVHTYRKMAEHEGRFSDRQPLNIKRWRQGYRWGVFDDNNKIVSLWPTEELAKETAAELTEASIAADPLKGLGKTQNYEGLARGKAMADNIKLSPTEESKLHG